MIIIGAKGFAKEVLQVVLEFLSKDLVLFYDDLNFKEPDKLFDTYSILKTEQEVVSHFKVDKRFTVGIGHPFLRKTMSDKFKALGGVYSSTISQNATIGQHEVFIGNGCNILAGAILSNSVQLGEGCMIYYNSVITHDVCLGDFVEISPSATILGRSQIGSFTQIGAHATILPDINIGKNVIVAAGAVVTKDVLDHSMVAGVPAVWKKNLKPLAF